MSATAPTAEGERAPVVRDSDRPAAYAWLIAMSIAGQAFAGSWGLYGSPVPLDRVLLAAGLLALAVHPNTRAPRWRLRPVHLLMVVAAAWCIGSMIWFGTSTDPTAIFALLDSFGIVPFLLWILAPVIFATAAHRGVLAAVLTWLGLYIGYVSVAQGLGLYGFVVPQTIVQPEHEHFERALGPSLQVASNGLALLACGTFAAVYAAQTRGWRRLVGVLSFLLCAAGMLFTLTRSIWLAALVGALAVVLVERRLRAPALGLGAVLALAGAALFAAVPAVGDAVSTRAETSRSVFDRFNANDAALRVVAARPLTGVGYQRFHEVQEQWVWQSPRYPITNVGIDVHNVVLGHAAELGIPGALLWITVLGWAVVGAVRGPRDRALRPYRLAALAYGLGWVVVSMLAPIKYALPTSVLWVALGMISDPGLQGWVPSRDPADGSPAHPAVCSSRLRRTASVREASP